MRRASFFFVVSLASTTAFATVPRHAPSAEITPMGRSVGSPTSGHLVGGARLGDEPYIRVMPADRAGDVRWGLGSLVGMVDRAARRVRHLFPGAVLNVGHLSKQGGGNIEMHASHESGRDADLPFYVDDAHGKQVFSEHMVPFRGDGTSAVWPGAHFDDAKNWALVAALLEDPVARVTHIFVSAPLRLRLLAFAAHAGVAEALRTRAAFTMVQPRGTLPHDDHFHVRIGCPEGMRGCIENPAVHFARRAPHGRRHHEVVAPDGHGAEPRSTPEPAPASTSDVVEGDGG
ncbi:MAG TPA: penicillin-insensitive murein endopeptidase [Polyangiaceae bacterium]|jgi:penicillin-insensitive murein endopeptidase